MNVSLVFTLLLSGALFSTSCSQTSKLGDDADADGSEVDASPDVAEPTLESSFELMGNSTGRFEGGGETTHERSVANENAERAKVSVAVIDSKLLFKMEEPPGREGNLIINLTADAPTSYPASWCIGDGCNEPTVQGYQTFYIFDDAVLGGADLVSGRVEVDTCALEVGEHVRGRVTDIEFDYSNAMDRTSVFIYSGTFELYVIENDGSLSCD